MKTTDPIIVSTAQLAHILNLSARRVQQLREEGMPRSTHGKWELSAAIPWYMEHVERAANPKDKTSEEAQRRYYLARAGLTEQKEAEAKGSAVSLAEHSAVVSELCADIANEIESFPTREFTQPHERQTAGKICDRLRTRLANRVATTGSTKRTRGRPKNTSAAAQPKREPVGRDAPESAAT